MPPQKITIIDEKGITRDSKVGPYVEGQRLYLFCDVHGGEYKYCKNGMCIE